MRKTQINFYATEADLHPPLSEAEKYVALQFTLAGMFQSSVPQIYLSHIEIPDLGQTTHPTAIANPTYLISPRDTEIHVREVPQRGGTSLFAIDQLENPNTIVLQPGGTYRDNNIILAGMIGTISRSGASRRLYNLVAREFRKRFDNCGGVLVGLQAKEKWNLGARLTIGALSPREFDLKHESNG